MIQHNKTKAFTSVDLVKLALLIALSVVGAQIKISGSIALDALPAFFAALYLGPVLGGIVGMLGHLASAMTAGFQLTLPMHLFVALQMWVIVYVFGVLWKKINTSLAILVAILMNGPVAAVTVVPVSIFLGLPLNGWGLFSVIWIPLTGASIANVLLAVLIYKRVVGRN